MLRSDRKGQFTKALMELRELVLNGELEPGERVSEVSISKRIGISRTPLREAMARLMEEGLLERNPSGGCRVRHFSVEDVLDAIELRGVIEGMAARRSAERGADPVALRQCSALLDEIDQALGTSEEQIQFEFYADLNVHFHSLLARLCNSETILREFDRVTRMPLASPSAFLKGQVTLRTVRRSLYVAQSHHRALVDAIEHREGARAEALAREHANLAANNLADVMKFERKAARAIPGLALLATT